jgi:hypothetical protein
VQSPAPAVPGVPCCETVELMTPPCDQWIET